jgi:hypothetical protein
VFSGKRQAAAGGRKSRGLSGFTAAAIRYPNHALSPSDDDISLSSQAVAVLLGKVSDLNDSLAARQSPATPKDRSR